MIRIDEIYSHTFWPWIRDNRPGLRLFYCDPFGHVGPQHLYNFGTDVGIETDYVFMHDQEPIQISTHSLLFDEVVRRNGDMWYHRQAEPPGCVIVSELGDNVKQLESIYGWRSLYYFFHGWACLDWYRGYNRTFLIPSPGDRAPASRTFMSHNRIVGGERDHRVLFLYHLLQSGISKHYTSAPRICPVEKQDITEIAAKYSYIYPDIVRVLHDGQLPWLFDGESTQQMTSCWLSNFQEASDSLVYVPTETVYFGNRTHITEKTFKAIALGMPFILVAAAGSLEYLKSYGFKTFHDVFDESYDQETDDLKRLELVIALLKDLDTITDRERVQIQRHLLPTVQHNWNHFYHGGLEHILWIELLNLFNDI